MDFKRIEFLFLIAFSVLTVFLGVSYFNTDNSLKSTTVTTTQSSQILSEIKNDRIKYGKLSNEQDEGYYLVTSPVRNLQKATDKLKDQTWTIKDNKLQSNLINNRNVTSRANTVKDLEKFKSKESNIINGKEYDYDAKRSSDTQIVFAQRYLKKTFLDDTGCLKFNISNGKIISYEQTYVGQLTTLREKELIISEEQALIRLYQYNEIPSNSTIKWSQLVYTKLIGLKNNAVYIPAWFIEIESKTNGNTQVKRINAFSGAIIKNATDLSEDSTSSTAQADVSSSSASPAS